MRRLLATPGALLCALVMLCGALAAAADASPALARAVVHGSASGTVTSVGQSWLTIQTRGRRVGVINAMIATADKLTRADYPYVWGGGHDEAGVASAGIPGPGYNGHTVGYDCSGSVAAVLAGAGVWPAGSPVPNDAGIIQQLSAEGLIARGPGRSPDEVTLYDYPDVHIFMNIDGRFFGTSDGAGGGSRRGGPGWLYDGAPDAGSRNFREYHILPSVLRDRTRYGHTLTFQTGRLWSLAEGAQPGDAVKVAYSETHSGTMSLRALSYVHTRTLRATLTSLSGSGTGLTVQEASGKLVNFAAPKGALLPGNLQIGDQLAVTYTKNTGKLTERAITITALPTTTTSTSTSGNGPQGSGPGYGPSAS